MRSRNRGNIIAHRKLLALALLITCAGSLGAQLATPPQFGCTENGAWAKLILQHVARYPAMQLPDLYKLLHQSTMGSEHAIRDLSMVRDWMQRELASLGAGPDEPLVDTLGHDGRFARVHLRPFVERNGTIDSLLRAFVATGTTAPPDPIQLRCALDAARELSRHGRIPWKLTAINRYFAARAATGFEAVEHSAGFSKAYRPAYRVIALPLVSGALTGIQRPARP
jgi:hypothetical protein